MAFNPFHAFRKYSKTMFAVLMIVCMITFVMSSGLGGRSDFLSSPPDWVPFTDKNPEAARIDGHKVTTKQLQDLKIQRQMADLYIRQAIQTVHAKVVEQMDKRLKEFDQNKDYLTLQDLRQMVMVKSLSMNPQFGDRAFSILGSQGRGAQMPPEQVVYGYIYMLNSYISRFEKDKRTDDVEMLTKFRKVLLQDYLRMTRSRGDLYFGGSLRSGDDLLDFLVWKWAAEKRGIELSQPTVEKLLDDETLGELTKDDSVDIEKLLQKNFRNYKGDQLNDALANEFCVRIAQVALLGQSINRENIPAYVTPYEFWTYFDDVRTAIRVGMLPVKVEEYVKQVTAQPSEGELKELFDKYRKEEPAPFLENPGFKEPKRVKIEWLSGKADSPYFRKAGLEEGKKETFNSAARIAAISLPPVGGILPSLGGVASATYRYADLPEFRLESEYRNYQSRDRIMSWTDSALFFFAVHEYTVVNPNIIAATIGDMLASKASGGTVLSPCLTLASQSVAQEMRERVRLGLAPLAGIGGGPWPVMGYPAAIPQGLALGVVRNQLLEKVNDELTREKFAEDLRKFQEELEKRSKDVKDIKKKGSKEEIAKYIDEFVKTHELTKGASKELDDQFSIVNDPGLKPLHDKYFENQLVAKSDPTGLGFGQQFFSEGGFRGPMGLYQPTWFQSSGPSPGPFNAIDTAYYLAWKTEEVESKMRTFDKARDDVVKAWRWQRARDLAKKAAEQWQEKARESKGNLAVLKDLAAQTKAELIELGPMAKINMQPALNPLQPPQYGPYQIPRDKIHYPSAAMSNDLLDLRTKDLGTTIVVSDLPKAIFYVTTLTSRDHPTQEEFRQVYARAQSGDVLLSDLQTTRRIDFRKELIQQLRADAKVTVVTDELKRFNDRGTTNEE
ncbi:MAG TPA: hypothetical protein VGZ47_15105 [Gemmataceae bacterium]|jgi:hypothetical protein|nr:hypothetical protein [Gemmataceae bacterium]